MFRTKKKLTTYGSGFQFVPFYEVYALSIMEVYEVFSVCTQDKLFFKTACFPFFTFSCRSSTWVAAGALIKV